MATKDEAVQALTDAIAHYATLALATQGATNVQAAAHAANELAEARAWLLAPTQSHGGNTTTS